MSTDRPTIGVVAICYNEERDLPAFLEHLLPWVDEIVLIDDGSTDASPSIAASAGEKVSFLVSPRREGEYYAFQRNKGIDAAHSDWLLHMDIDERVPPALADEILQAVRQPGMDAYRFRRFNYFLHRPMRGGGWNGWNQVHLARRACLRFSGMYHEKVELTSPAGRIGQLKNHMLHFNDESYSERLRKSASYQVEVAEKFKKLNRRLGYMDLLAAFVKEFFVNYFLKRGFLDGTTGLLWAFHSAAANERACALAWDEQNSIPRSQLEDELRQAWQRKDRSRDQAS